MERGLQFTGSLPKRVHWLELIQAEAKSLFQGPHVGTEAQVFGPSSTSTSRRVGLHVNLCLQRGMLTLQAVAYLPCPSTSPKCNEFSLCT